MSENSEKKWETSHKLVKKWKQKVTNKWKKGHKLVKKSHKLL